MLKIDGVVVLYNPEDNVIENIESYITYIESLYVIDNSDTKNTDLIAKIKNNSKCKYVDNKGNKGIAQALNCGAKLAMENSSDWLLTMDQDSRFQEHSLSEMIVWIQNHKTTKIGIVSPMHSLFEIESYNKIFDIVTMTSGNLLNLNIFKENGDFEEKLFIDSVDTEYCLRLKSNGYKIKRMKSIILEHNCGDLKKVGVLGFRFLTTNHNPTRRYYMMRNRLYVWKMYKKQFPTVVNLEKLVTLKEVIKIILAEKDKLLKLKMMIRGFIDFRINKFGKIDT